MCLDVDSVGHKTWFCDQSLVLKTKLWTLVYQITAVVQMAINVLLFSIMMCLCCLFVCR